MRSSLISLVLAVVVGAGSAALFASQQGQPGMSPARFWINNRTADEAIPVNINGFANIDFTDRAVGTLNQIHGKTQATSAARQLWEYRQVIEDSRQDYMGVLNQLGNDGCEAVGISTDPANGRKIVLFKRPR